MHLLGKLRAILTLGVVSGIFWWLAFALGRAGYELIEYGRFGLAFGGRIQLTIAFLGFMGGVIYATAIALLPQREGRPTLSPGRAALLGALGGAVVLAVLRFGIIGDVISGGLLGSVIFPMAVCSALGAGTALAISGTAKRGGELEPSRSVSGSKPSAAIRP
jgi:hypothetical protein